MLDFPSQPWPLDDVIIFADFMEASNRESDRIKYLIPFLHTFSAELAEFVRGFFVEPGMDRPQSSFWPRAL